MILQTSWYIVPVVSLFVAIITVIPDLYARFKYRHTWIPVGSPPGMIGDDYHYFTLLNHLHRKLLNFLPGVTLTSVSFSANSKFQLAGYIFNLIPFHIGFLLEDRRMGVLFVRIWNRFILGIASTNLAYLIISHLGLPRTWPTAIACYLFFFVAYPGPFGIQTLQSIVFQTNNYRHIYERANANDLTRAMFAETTAPILMIGMSFLILFLDLKNPLYLLLVTVSLGFLSFHYFPSALVLALITMVICFFLVHNYAILILLGMIISIYIVLYLYLVGKDEVGKEIFAHNDSGKIIKKFGKYDILYFASIIIPYLLSNKLIQPDIIVQVIQVSLLFFLLSHFFYKHQISRFWDRAANILFQFIAATILVGLMSNNIENKFFVLYLNMALLIILIVYHYNQALFNLKSDSNVLPNALLDSNALDLLGFDQKSNKLIERKSEKIATDSIELAYALDMFSAHDPLLRNYSVQNSGYKKHLVSIVVNFKILGYSLDEFISIFTTVVHYRDWLYSRPFESKSLEQKKCYIHTLQYLATNREYNNKLSEDGMYDSDGWTDNYKEMLTRMWEEEDLKLVVDDVKVFKFR